MWSIYLFSGADCHTCTNQQHVKRKTNHYQSVELHWNISAVLQSKMKLIVIFFVIPCNIRHNTEDKNKEEVMKLNKEEEGNPISC